MRCTTTATAIPTGHSGIKEVGGMHILDNGFMEMLPFFVIVFGVLWMHEGR